MDSSRLLPAVQKLVKLFNADSAPQRGRIGLFNFILQIFIMIIQSLVNVLIHKPRRRIKRAQGQSGLDAAILDDWSDRQKNEYMTDVISCLVGFSKIMIRGYMVMTHARYRVIMWDTNSMRVGYLDAVDCEHVREVLLEQPPELQKRLKERTDREALRLEVERNIAGAKAMLEQIEAMYESHSIPKPGHMSKANLSVLQNALLSLETGELRTRLNQCESQRDVAAASKEIASLCKELTVLHAAFR